MKTKSTDELQKYFTYLDTLTETERQSNAKFRLRQKFEISRGKAQKILGAYYLAKKRND